MQNQELKGVVFERAMGELRGFIFPDGVLYLIGSELSLP